MAWLYQATSTAKGIQMGNEEWGHTLAIGTNWTKLRIGWRGYCQTLMAFKGHVFGTAVIGVCTGTAQMFKSPICTEFMGLGMGNSSVPDWTFATSPANHVINTRPVMQTKLNGAFVAQNTGSAAEYISALAAARTQMFVDITKNGSGSYTIQGWLPGNTTQATTDNTYNQFIGSMENNTTPTNCSATVASTFNWAGAGLMDTMYFSWAKSVPVLVTCDLAACRLL